MLELGPDILEQVLCLLSSQDLVRLAQTCSSLKELVHLSHAWNGLYEIDFPVDSVKLPGSGFSRYKRRYCARIGAIVRDESMERCVESIGKAAIVDFATVNYFTKGKMVEGFALRRINDTVELVASHGTHKILSIADLLCLKVTFSYVLGVKDGELLMWNTKHGVNEGVEDASDMEVVAKIPDFLAEKLDFSSRKFDRACDSLVNPRMIYEIMNCTDTGAIFKFLKNIPTKINHLVANHDGIVAVAGSTMYMAADVEREPIYKTLEFDTEITKLGMLPEGNGDEDGKSYEVYALDERGCLFLVTMTEGISVQLKAEGLADFNSDRDIILLSKGGSVSKLDGNLPGEHSESPSLFLHQTFRGGVYGLLA